jgi:uncharacterized protein YutE (UPF0331/DUF86 family)
VIRPEVIRKRLNKLDEYLTILRGLQAYDLEEFTSAPERYGSAERFLHLAIEAVIDLGNHTIAGLQLGEVNWYSDIPLLLFDAGYIDDELKEKWTRMIGFRNVLVHDYLDIDRKIVYDILRNHLEDIDTIKRVFAQFL